MLPGKYNLPQNSFFLWQIEHSAKDFWKNNIRVFQSVKKEVFHGAPTFCTLQPVGTR